MNDAERRAARHYRLRGYRILATNAWAGPYELDVVARRGRRLVFCEAHHLVRGAVPGVRFDVVSVDGGALTRIADAF